MRTSHLPCFSHCVLDAFVPSRVVEIIPNKHVCMVESAWWVPERCSAQQRSLIRTTQLTQWSMGLVYQCERPALLDKAVPQLSFFHCPVRNLSMSSLVSQTETCSSG